MISPKIKANKVIVGANTSTVEKDPAVERNKLAKKLNTNELILSKESQYYRDCIKSGRIR